MKKLLLFTMLCACICITQAASVTMAMNFENTPRTFIIHLPASFIAGQSLPLVFNHHGYTSNASQEEFYTKMNATSDANNFIVVYPEGISNAWNSGFTAPYNSSPNDVGFISKIIDTLVTLYNINTNRVYSCGMSNGGFQSYRLACDLENRIAAIASVTGTIATLAATNCALTRKVPVMHVHGTADSTVPYAGFTGAYGVEETINFWLGKNGCTTQSDTVDLPNANTTDGTTVKKIRYTNCGDGTEVLFYKVDGGGHTWPSGLIDIPANGPTNRDFDASQEIWDFFNRFTLNGPVSGVEEVTSEIEVAVFPNPSEGKYEIRNMKYENEQPVNVIVCDATGRKVLEQKAFSSSTEINLTGVERGIYFLKLESKGFSASKKLVKE